MEPISIAAIIGTLLLFHHYGSADINVPAIVTATTTQALLNTPIFHVTPNHLIAIAVLNWIAKRNQPKAPQ